MDQRTQESAEATESKIQSGDSTGARSEVDGMSLQEQRSITAVENARKTAAAEDYLPGLSLFDDEILPITAATEAQALDPGSNPGAAVCTAGDAPDALMDSEGVKEVMDKNFDRIDSDGDGHLSSAEIDKAMVDPCFTGKDAQVLAAVKQQQTKLAELSDDEIGFENDGVTRQDIAELDRLARERRESINTAEDIRDVGKDNFDKLDSDNDGFISKSEVDKALQDAPANCSDREKLEKLKTNFDKVQDAANDEWGFESKGVSREDLEQYRTDVREDDVNAQIIKMDLTLFERGTRLKETNHDLYGDMSDPNKSIRADAITQGNSGDCTFIAATSALARVNPEAIKQMIHDNQDGTYTVTFPGDPSHPVTIDKPTDAELATYATGGQDGIWPAVLEKAYGLHRKADGIGAENADSSNPNEVLALLTGKEVVPQSPHDMTNDELEKVFMERANYPMTAGLHGELLPFTDGKDDETGLPRGHAYTIVGFDPQTKEVIIRNPQGENEPLDANGNAKDGKDNGVFRMPLSEFQKKFDRLSHTKTKS